MTLNTRILFTGPTSIETLWADVLDLLAPGDNDHSPLVKEAPSNYPQEGISDSITRQTVIGQGLPAWTSLAFRESRAPFPAYTESEDDYDNPRTFPLHFATLSFDTGYGYYDEYGGCSMLHARYIVALADLGYSFIWINEFDGAMHVGPTGITALLESGDEAREWYTSVVLPVMERIITKGMS